MKDVRLTEAEEIDSPVTAILREQEDFDSLVQEGTQRIKFCGTCKYFKPRGKTVSLFSKDNDWRGDGKCRNKLSWSDNEYPFYYPSNITVESSSCEHHKEEVAEE